MAGHRHGPGRIPEKPKNFKGTITKLFRCLGRYRLPLVLVLVLALASTAFGIVGPKILSTATTELATGLGRKLSGLGGIDFGKIGKILLTVLALYLVSAACSFFQSWILAGITQKLAYRLRGEISAKIHRMPMRYFERNTVGDVLSRITNDVDTLGQSLNQSVTQLITSVTQIIGVLVMMLSISLPLTGVTVLTLPAAAIILTVMIHFSQPYFREQQQVLGTVNGIIEEDFAGQNVIQVFDRAEASIERRSELLARRSELLQRREELLGQRNIVHERIAQAFPALREGKTNGPAFTRVHEHAQRRKQLAKALKAKARELKNKAKDRS